MLKKLFKSKKSIFGVEINDWLIIAIALAIFTVISFWTISKFSIWFDEAFGAYLIRFNFWDIAKYTAADVHPPFFYWLLKLWSLLFGTSELALRSMSTLFGGIAIIFGYLLVNKLFNKKAARLSLLVMVMLPMFIRYSQEARMYTLVTAIAFAATYVLTIAMNSKKKTPWVIYGILVSLGMWTHYFAAIVWIAHWIWRADNIRRTTKKGEFKKAFFSKEWVMTHVVAVGLFLPWLPFMIKQLFVVQAFGFWIPPVTPNTMLNFLTNVLLYKNVGKITGWLALGFITVVLALGILSFKVYKMLNNKQRQSYRLIIILAFAPMIMLFLASMPPLRSSFVDRYLITSVLGIAIFIGVTLSFGLELIKTKWKFLLIGLIVMLMIVGIGSVYTLGNYNNSSENISSNNTRQIIEAATSKSTVGQPIIAATPWLFYEAVFYSTSDYPVYYIAPSDYSFGSLTMLKDNDQFKINDIDSFTGEHKNFWYVAWIKDVGLSGFKSPNSNWKELQRVSVNDSIDGKPSYIAVQFEINNN